MNTSKPKLKDQGSGNEPARQRNVSTLQEMRFSRTQVIGALIVFTAILLFTLVRFAMS